MKKKKFILFILLFVVIILGAGGLYTLIENNKTDSGQDFISLEEPDFVQTEEPLVCGEEISSYPIYSTDRQIYTNIVRGDIINNGSEYIINVRKDLTEHYIQICLAVSINERWEVIIENNLDNNTPENIDLIRIQDMNKDGKNEILILKNLLDMGVSPNYYIFVEYEGEINRLKGDIELFNPYYDEASQLFVSSNKVGANDQYIKTYILQGNELILSEGYVQRVTENGIIRINEDVYSPLI